MLQDVGISRTACMLLYKGHEYQGWNKDKHKLLLLQYHQLIAQRLSFPSWLDNQAIMATDGCRYSSKLKWVYAWLLMPKCLLAKP